MKKIIGGVVILVVMAVIGFLAFGDKDNGVKFKTEAITEGDIVSTVTATGTVNAVTTVQVGTQVSGTIKKIYVDYNSPVKQGQLIAEIDPTPFEAQVDQARANLAAAKANVEKAKATLDNAKLILDRDKELYANGLIIAKSDLDTAQSNHDADVAAVEAAKAQVDQTAAALKYAETNLRYTKILSPVNGTVVSRNVDVGQTVAASFQTPTLFTIAEDLTKMQIDTNVDEADIGKIQLGQDVDFTVDAYPDITFRGKVSQVRIAPIIVQNVVTYDAVVQVDNPDLKLKPGMTANVSLIVSSSKNVLRIPNAALRFVPPDAGKVSDYKGAGVWVLENGKPTRVQVTTGVSDGSYTELVSGNLKAGQQVIVESLNKTEAAGHPPRFF